MNEIPESILKNAFHDETEVIDFISFTDEYAKSSFHVARQFIDDLEFGHKHLDIHCISFSSSIKSLIGYSLEEFGNLIERNKDNLQRCWLHCPMILLPGESRDYCSIRFKVFLTLFRLKQGCSFRHMESIFGWSKSILFKWYDKVADIIDLNMNIWVRIGK